jgi:hypothetical protein
LRFVYAGSALLLPAEWKVGIVVPASSSMKASRRRAVTGRKVNFSGQVRSLPIPASRKRTRSRGRSRALPPGVTSERNQLGGARYSAHATGAEAGRAVPRRKIELGKHMQQTAADLPAPALVTARLCTRDDLPDGDDSVSV